MKTYELKFSESFKRMHSIWNAKSNLRKALDVLSGIILGIVADGSINSTEANFLKHWISKNKNELPLALINQLLPLLHKIENSDDLNDQEHDELLKLILSFSGASINNDGILLSENIEEPSNIGKTAEWYFYKDELTDSQLSNCEFSLSGNFQSGPKTQIIKLLKEIGSTVIPNQPINSTSYLIVGEKGSDQWACSQLGNSILKAISMQERGHNIKIIKETSFLATLASLREIGINPASENYAPIPAEHAPQDTPIAGKTFVITGTLSQPRPEFQKIIEANGGKVSGSISKNTDFLLCGENAGSKRDKAESLSVPILDEAAFNALL